ncbi:MAG: hypothetical protein AB3N23_12730 [Paracoccaceae bacterium]
MPSLAERRKMHSELDNMNGKAEEMVVKIMAHLRKVEGINRVMKPHVDNIKTVKDLAQKVKKGKDIAVPPDDHKKILDELDKAAKLEVQMFKYLTQAEMIQKKLMKS